MTDPYIVLCASIGGKRVTDPYLDLMLSSPKVNGAPGTHKRFQQWRARMEFWTHARDQPEPDTLPPEYMLDVAAVDAAISVAERLALFNFKRMLGASPEDI